jgi:hypothetical protein
LVVILVPATLCSRPQSTGVENVRGACHGTFIERNLKANCIDGHALYCGACVVTAGRFQPLCLMSEL